MDREDLVDVVRPVASDRARTLIVNVHRELSAPPRKVALFTGDGPRVAPWNDIA